jgi:EmrB/QacA subfamily drug resistance transporter
VSKWWTLIAVSLATFMLLLDVTIVNVALPSIEADLKASFSDLQWVVDAYALGLAAILLTAGSAADIVGRRLVFVVGLALFSTASLLCGLATDPLFLNLSRGLQGTGGALMFATSLALLASAYSGRDRGTAFGVWGATVGAAVAIGPLAGGVLTEAIGWEAIFFVNVPIGFGVILLTLRTVEETKNPAGGRVDIPGLITLSTALFLLIFALIRGNDEGWGSALITGFLIGAGVLLAVFVWLQRRSGSPMLDLSLFRRRSFIGASAAAFVLSASMFAMFLYLTLYIQNTLGYSALEAGLVFLPTSVLSFFVAPISGKLAERFGIRWFIGFGLLLVGGGLLVLGGLDPSDDWEALLPGFGMTGVGVGMVNPALATAAVGVVEAHRSGMASGINSTFRQVGIATGVAAWGAIFQGVVDDKADRFAKVTGARVPADFADFVSFGAYRSMGPEARMAGRQAFLDGLNHILVIAGVVGIVGGLLCIALIRPEDFVDH